MKHLISIVGPTASGKTALSLALARHYAAPVISADSVQIYRGLNIGSGKVTEEERGEVPHFMLDRIALDEEFSAGMFEREVDALLERLWDQYDVVLLVGGAGFYLGAVWEGFDEMPEVEAGVREQLNREFAEKGLLPLLEELREVDASTFEVVDRRNQMRVIRALEIYRSTGKPISHFRNRKASKVKSYQDHKIGIEWPRSELYDRINRRVERMVEAGLVEEVRALLAQFGPEAKGLQSVGYKEVVAHLQGKASLEATISLIQKHSRRYAKRQGTWFKRHADIHWMEEGSVEGCLGWLNSRMGK